MNICAKQVNIGYDSPILQSPFDFELRPGRLVALMGENGCGKSTLLKTFAGMLSVKSGSIWLGESLLSQYSLRERAKNIALVRISGMVPDLVSVREFVGLGRSPYSNFMDSRSCEDERIIDGAMELLDVACFANRPVSELSDGERTRVYLAEAVAQQVKFMLLDEPNAFLDIPRSHALFRLLKKLAVENQMGVIVSTHSVEYAEKYCDEIMVLGERLLKVALAAEARSKGLLDWTLAE